MFRVIILRSAVGGNSEKASPESLDLCLAEDPPRYVGLNVILQLRNRNAKPLDLCWLPIAQGFHETAPDASIVGRWYAPCFARNTLPVVI